MRYLVDTHALIWLAHENKPALSDHVKEIVLNKQHVLYVSMASLWEMAIKKALGKLDTDESFIPRIPSHGYEILPIAIPHVQTLLSLPHHHKDPFDRMLIAQALSENMALITRDRRAQAYGIKIILA